MEKFLPPPFAEVGEASGEELDIAAACRCSESWVHRSLAGRINRSQLPWSVIDIRSQRALCVTLKFKKDEGKGLLLQDPYLFSKEIDYVPRAHTDMDARCGKVI
jgi:hypothetical protein